MVRISTSRLILFTTAVAILALVAAVAIAGWLLHRSAPTIDGSEPIGVRCGDCPHLYRNNPDHPDISPQGLRDREFAVPKPDGIFRVLVLGDSVALGDPMPAPRTFCKRLETLLTPDGSVEVLNAGVAGYTPFNELHYYEEEGRAFEPDVVLVAFCMNDVADPRLHWIYTKNPIEEIPPEAIPNPEYDERHVKPILEQVRRRGRTSRGDSARLLLELTPNRSAREGGRIWPTYVTGEDDFDIRVLTDPDSPEWKWLCATYDHLVETIRADGARPAFAFFPLAYQLDPDYPFLPQVNLLRYCNKRGFDCLDLLPAFRANRDQGLFRDDTTGWKDIWHLSETGHELAARELAAFLLGRGLASVNE